MKTTSVVTFSLLLVLTVLAPSLATAQALEPPNVPTLGPVILCSSGDSSTYVKIFSPQNLTYASNPIQLSFKVSAVGMFGQFCNVGYSLDGGTVCSVRNFINKTVTHPRNAPDWYWNSTTAFATVTLPRLATGIHSVTVYYGAQYLGTNNPKLERFEVFAYETAVFEVDAEPQHQSSIIINANGSLSPSAPIQQTGTTYALMNDIDGSITVHASDVVLEGNGHTLRGIALKQTQNVTVQNFAVAFAGERIGISLSNASNNLVANNTVSRFWSIYALNGLLFAGISVTGGDSNKFIQNVLSDNLEGMAFANTSYNLIMQNNITSNPLWSPYTGVISFFGASNNTVYHNNFVNSTHQATSINSANAWDNGYPDGGNYWGDYQTKYPNASTIENSAVSNTPYYVDAQNRDNYPLIQPFNISLPVETSPIEADFPAPASGDFPIATATAVLAVSVAVIFVGAVAAYRKKRRSH